MDDKFKIFSSDINLITYNALDILYNRLNKQNSNICLQKEFYARNSLISRYPCPVVSPRRSYPRDSVELIR